MAEADRRAGVVSSRELTCVSLRIGTGMALITKTIVLTGGAQGQLMRQSSA